jgi:hypothetical protein
MDSREMIRRYEAGVVFECGCEERGLHPAIERQLLNGNLSPNELLRCPVHRKAMREAVIPTETVADSASV